MSRKTMDLMQQIRLMGGTSAYSPSDCWFNLCSTLEWPIENDVDEPQRFQPAFFTASRKKGRDIPVIVEPYSYVPDDTDDPLADEAMSKLPSLFQGEILLVFRGLPFMETDGHFYTFGGLLYGIYILNYLRTFSAITLKSGFSGLGPFRVCRSVHCNGRRTRQPLSADHLA